MKKSRIFLLNGIVFMLFLFGCGKDVGSSPIAPDFSTNDIDGQNITLSQFRGQVVLLDFWATWCPPCRQAIPELVELQQKYRDQGLVVLGFSMDDPQQADDEYLKAFKEKFSINYPILRGTYEVARNYFGDANIALPTLFVINKEGEVVDKHVGFYPGAVENSLKKLLE